MTTPNVPGITYKPITPSSWEDFIGGSGGPSDGKADTSSWESFIAGARNPNKLNDDLTTITSDYTKLQTSLDARANPKEDQPLWKKVLTSAPAKLAMKAAQLSSVSEMAYKIPGIGEDIQAGVEKVPGLRTALAVGSNPITWLTGGTAGAVGLAAVGAGLGTAAGVGYEHTDLPGAGSGYAPFIGGALGGLAGVKASGMLAAGRAAEENAAVAARSVSAAQNLPDAEQGILRPGFHLNLHPDDTFSPLRPGLENPDIPLITVKNPDVFSFNAATKTYNVVPPVAQDMEKAAALNAAKQMASHGAMGAEGEVNGALSSSPAFDVVSRGSTLAEQVAKMAGPAVKTIYRNPIARFPIDMVKPMVTMGGAISKATAPYIAAGAGLGAAATALGIAPGGASITDLTHAPNFGSTNAPGMVAPGNIDLNNRSTVHNPDGTISTVRSISITDDKGQVIVIPTVIGNRVVSNEEAIAHWRQTGESLGTFQNEQTADAYAQSVHEGQAAQMSKSSGGFWGQMFDKLGDIAAPAVDPWINTANKAFEALPEPVQAGLATGAHDYESVINATLGPVTAKVDQAMRQAVRPMDAAIYAFLPDKYADPITEAIDTVAGFAPWMAVGYLTAGLGVAPDIVGAITKAQTLAFGAQGLADGMKTWEAYKQGDISTGAFLSSMGMSGMMVGGVKGMGEHATAAADARRGAIALRDMQSMYKDNPMLIHDDMVRGAPAYVQEFAKQYAPNATPEQLQALTAQRIAALDHAFSAVGQVAEEQRAASGVLSENYMPIPGRYAEGQAAQPPPEEHYAEAAKATLTGGVTFDYHTGTPVDMRGKWMVGTDTPGAQVLKSAFTAKDLADYVANNAIFQDPRFTVGTEIVSEDGNHHTLPAEQGGQAYVNIDPVIPVGTEAEARAIMATIPNSHIHEPMDARAPGEGGFKDAQGRDVSQPTQEVVPTGGVEAAAVTPPEHLGTEGQVAPTTAPDKTLPEVHMMPKADVFPATDNPEHMAGSTSGDGRDIGTHAANGQLVGYPKGITNQHGVDMMRAQMKAYADAGAQYRYWYEESSHAVIKAMYGVDLGNSHDPNFTQRVTDFVTSRSGDVENADRFVQFLAILSAQRKVPINTNLALRAWMQKQSGTELHNLNLPDQYHKLEAAYNGQDWGNLKTNRFYLALLKNINPAKYAILTNGESTIDIWMMRALGYKKEVPTPAQYIAAAREVERMAQEHQWTGDQMQAAIWVGAKMNIENITGQEAGYHFGHGLEAQTAQLTLMPGRNAHIAIPADAPPELVIEYNRLVSEAIDHHITDLTGIPMPNNFVEGEQMTQVTVAPVGPGGKTARPMVEEHTKGLLQGITALLAKYSGADSATWAAGIELDKHVWAQNAKGVETNRPISDAEARQMEDNLRAQGVDARVEKTPTGFWVLNQSKNYDAVDWREVIKESSVPERVGQPTEPRTAASTTPEIKAASREMTQLSKRIKAGKASPEDTARYEELTSQKEKFGYRTVTDSATVRALAAEGKEFSAKVAQVVQTTLPGDVHAVFFGMRYDGGTVDGNNIGQSIRNSGISQEVEQRLDAIIQPRIDAVNQQFASEHGWEIKRELAPAGTERTTGLGTEGRVEDLPTGANRMVPANLEKYDDAELLKYGRQLSREVMSDSYVEDELKAVQAELAKRMQKKGWPPVPSAEHPSAITPVLDRVIAADNVLRARNGDKPMARAAWLEAMRGYPPLKAPAGDPLNFYQRLSDEQLMTHIFMGDGLENPAAVATMKGEAAKRLDISYDEIRAQGAREGFGRIDQTASGLEGDVGRLKSELGPLAKWLDRVPADVLKGFKAMRFDERPYTTNGRFMTLDQMAAQYIKTQADLHGESQDPSSVRAAIARQNEAMGRRPGDVTPGTSEMPADKMESPFPAGKMPANGILAQVKTFVDVDGKNRGLPPVAWRNDRVRNTYIEAFNRFLDNPDNQQQGLANTNIRNQVERKIALDADSAGMKAIDALPAPDMPASLVMRAANARRAQAAGVGSEAEGLQHIKDLAAELAKMNLTRYTKRSGSEQNDLRDKRDAIEEAINQIQQQRVDAELPRLFVPEMAGNPPEPIVENKRIMPNATIYDPHGDTYYGNGKFAQHEYIIKTLGITSGYYDGLRELFREGYVRLEAMPEDNPKPGEAPFYRIDIQAGDHAQLQALLENLVKEQHLPDNTRISFDLVDPEPGDKSNGAGNLIDFYVPQTNAMGFKPPPLDKAAWLSPEGKWISQSGGRGTHLGAMEEHGLDEKLGVGDIPGFIDAGYIRVYNTKEEIVVQAKDRAGVEKVAAAMPVADADKKLIWDYRPDKGQDMTYGFIQRGMEKSMAMEPDAPFKPEIGSGEMGVKTVKDFLPKETGKQGELNAREQEKATREAARAGGEYDPNAQMDAGQTGGPEQEYKSAKADLFASQIQIDFTKSKMEEAKKANDPDEFHYLQNKLYGLMHAQDYIDVVARVKRGQRYGAEGEMQQGFLPLHEEEAGMALHSPEANPEFMRAKSYNTMGDGKTYEEHVREDSKPVLETLDNATRSIGDKPLASRTGEHAKVLDELQSMPATRELVRFSVDALDSVKTAFRELDLMLPDMENIKYGGIVLDRVKEQIPGDGTGTRENQASFNLGENGQQTIVNDPLLILEKADKNALAPADETGYTVSTRDAFADRITENAFHEAVHAIILGHKGDFRTVLDQLKGSQQYRDTHEQAGQLYDRLESSGQLEQLRKVASDARRIDARQPAPGTDRWNERRAVVPPDERGLGNGNNRVLPAESNRDSGVRRPTGEAGQGLETGVPVGHEAAVNTDVTRGTAGANAGGGTEVGGNGTRPAGTRLGTEGATADERTHAVKRASRESNADYDVVERYRDVSKKVTIKDGGAGLVFLRAAEEDKKNNSVTPALPDIKTIMTDEFADNYLHKIGIKAGEGGGWKKLIAHVIGGDAATAGTEYEKAIAAYHILKASGDSRKYLTMNWLHQDSAPFKEIIEHTGRKSGRIEIENAKGETVNAFLGDVFSNPSQYKLGEGQRAYIDKIHRIIDEHVAELRANGVDVHELGFEKKGEHYFPRLVAGQDGFEFEDPRSNPLKPRYHESMAAGTASGLTYAHPLEALEQFVDWSNKRIASQKFLEAIKPYGVTGREMALEHVGYVTRERYNPKTGQKEEVKTFAPLKAASEVVRGTRADVRQKTRELAAAMRGKRETAIKADVRTNMAELNKKVNELDSVQKLRARIDKAKTDRTKTKLGDELKKLIASERGKIRRADVKSSTRVVDKAAKIEAAKSALDASKERDHTARIALRKTSSEMSSIVKAKQSARTADAENLPEPLVNGLGLTGDIRVKGVPSVPTLNGHLFPEKVADAIEAGLGDKSWNGAFKVVTQANDFARLAKASTDFGYLFIQGLPVLTRHPLAFGKAMVQSLKVFASPEGYAQWLASKKHVTDDMYPYAGGFSGSEYYTATKGNKMKQWADTSINRANPGSLLTAGFGKTMQRFGVSFEAFLDAAKVSMWEGMMPHMKTTADKVAYGRLVRNMTGTTDTARMGVSKNARQIEGILAFSPRFTRSIFALAIQAFEKGPAQREAILSIGALLGGAAIIYTGAKMAMGQQVEPADFDPTQGGRFMSVKVGNNWYGLGGSARGAIQLMGNIVASIGKPERFISLDSTSNDKSNPFLKFARGRAAPFTSNIIDFATGSTVIGQDTTDRAAWLSRLPDAAIPFGVQATVEAEGGTADKMGGFMANLGGLRSYPEAANEDLNQSVRDFANDKTVGGWNDLTSTQKAEMLTKHPALQQLIDKSQTDKWNTYKQVALEAANAKKDLAAEWLKTQGTTGGEKVTAADVTSKDYRDKLDNINQRLIGARSALNGANSITGLGGTDFNANANTPRQKLMNAYHAAVDKNKFMMPDGSVDWEIKDAMENSFMSSISPEQQKIVQEETVGTSLDPLENRLKQARADFKPYWDLRDSVAKTMGYDNALAITQAPRPVQTMYNKQLGFAQTAFRRANPEIDKNLKLWGYTSKTVDEVTPSSGGSGNTKDGLYATKGLYPNTTKTSSNLYASKGLY